MEGFLWTPWQTLGVGLEVLVFFMSLIIFLSLFPPYQFGGVRDYLKYLAMHALAIIGVELFALFLVLVLASMDNFFFSK